MPEHDDERDEKPDPSAEDDQGANVVPDLGVSDGTEIEATSPAETEDFQRIVQLLPPKEQAQLVGIMTRESMSHSGWLPTPDFMRAYEEVLPGLAERIVAMPEREQGFRHETTRDVIGRDYRLRTRGQVLGIAALVIILAFSVFLALLGHPAQAAFVAVTLIVGTVGVFVTGQLTGNKTTSKDVLEEPEE